MVPKLMRGISFKGAAAYLLHDVHADSAERVGWTEVRNLASSNPHTAWRVMAATAMDADRLKAQAGVKATGRKSAESVLHLVLSWHPEEAPNLDRQQMLAAAESALQAIGAADRQALIIAHTDSAHPHVHVLINRISPIDGRMLSSSKEKLKLSKWAQKYEEERGKIYCEERVLNNEARERGDYIRAAKGIPWQVIKADNLIRAAANDNDSKAERFRTELRERMRSIGQHMRAIQNRHAAEWQAFEAAHIERRAAIIRSFHRLSGKAREAIIAEYRPRWRDLRAEEQAEAARLKDDETSRLGRVRSALRSIRSWRTAYEGDPLRAVTQAWSGLFSAEKRKEILEHAQQQRRTSLENEQRRAIRQAVAGLHVDHRLSLRTNAEAYRAERSSLILAHRADQAKLRAEWSQLRQDRQKMIAELGASKERKQTFERAASGQSYFDRLKRMADADRTAAPEQDNERGRERDRER